MTLNYIQGGAHAQAKVSSKLILSFGLSGFRLAPEWNVKNVGATLAVAQKGQGQALPLQLRILRFAQNDRSKG